MHSIVAPVNGATWVKSFLRCVSAISISQCHCTNMWVRHCTNVWVQYRSISFTTPTWVWYHSVSVTAPTCECDISPSFSLHQHVSATLHQRVSATLHQHVSAISVSQCLCTNVSVISVNHCYCTNVSAILVSQFHCTNMWVRHCTNMWERYQSISFAAPTCECDTAPTCECNIGQSILLHQHVSAISVNQCHCSNACICCQHSCMAQAGAWHSLWHWDAVTDTWWWWCWCWVQWWLLLVLLQVTSGYLQLMTMLAVGKPSLVIITDSLLTYSDFRSINC